MEAFDRAAHWENIYQTKSLNEVSWYQAKPEISLELIAACNLGTDAAIIDIGGGDSFLSQYLLEAGYSDLSVLDISQQALKRAQDRLGEKADKMHWIHSDIVNFVPTRSYTIWHDRAAFHFLTAPEDVAAYRKITSSAIPSGGFLIVGTFADDGPLKCSGIDIHQYDEQGLTDVFSHDFEVVKFIRLQHETPFNTTQNFIFGVFKRK